MTPGRSATAGGRRRVGRLARACLRRAPQAFETLFPPCCVLCRRGLSAGRPPLCPVCEHRLPRVAAPRCRRCGATDVLGEGHGAGCPACWDWPEGLPAARAPFQMDRGAAELVRALKYGGWTRLAPPMGRRMVRGALDLAAGAEPAPVLVPVPLTRARRRERGFNQAELLARSLSEATGWEMTRALRRRSGRRRQASLGRSERLRNVDAGFVAARRPGTPRAPALVVDDVLTTGATAAACSSALSAAGWTPVGTVVFARALHPVP